MAILYRPLRLGEYPTLVPAEHGGGVIAIDPDRPMRRPEWWYGTAHERDHQIVGHLRWYRDDYEHQPLEISQVTVDWEYRRQGIATRMLREAQKIEPGIRHSRLRTADGDAWAKSTGDAIPVRHWNLERLWARPHSFDRITQDITHKIRHEAQYEEVLR
ncbi:GNAT family N-acetyltransferase [Streptomyces sp. NPDC012769]|uniref:GNAT family N-acetyltransferase n=1 Tax=Streptomyces sp. NPDC012769 TaxID=3364848 RepID=UPI00368C03DE